MSDLDHNNNFNQAEKELEKADRMYNITLSRLESQPRVKVVSKTSTYNNNSKSPDYNNCHYKQRSMHDVFTRKTNSPMNRYQTNVTDSRKESAG